MRPRRYLPSLSLLVAFEAVARTRSATAAARELDITQSTVSRLVRNLELQLGRDLFIRRNRRLIPTEAALAYRREIARALDLIQQASLRHVAQPEGGSLALAVLPTFGARWLAGRLQGFFDAHPGIALHLSTRIRRFAFRDEPFDAVIFFGAPDWPGCRHLKLFDERLTACASPEFLAAHPIARPADLAAAPLLRLETRAAAWEAWFAAQEESAPQAPRGPGMLMDQFSMMIQAAISGLGVALLPDYLARQEIEGGRLAPVLRPSTPGTGAYWLAWPEEKDGEIPLMKFREWLEKIARLGS